MKLFQDQNKLNKQKPNYVVDNVKTYVETEVDPDGHVVVTEDYLAKNPKKTRVHRKEDLQSHNSTNANGKKQHCQTTGMV